jgi:hypothetical protein
MQELAFLKDLVIVFALGLVVVTLLGRLRVPSIAGYIVAGVLVGPGVLGLVIEPEQIAVGIILPQALPGRSKHHGEIGPDISQAGSDEGPHTPPAARTPDRPCSRRPHGPFDLRRLFVLHLLGEIETEGDADRPGLRPEVEPAATEAMEILISAAGGVARSDQEVHVAPGQGEAPRPRGEQDEQDQEQLAHLSSLSRGHEYCRQGWKNSYTPDGGVFGGGV